MAEEELVRKDTVFFLPTNLEIRIEKYLCKAYYCSHVEHELYGKNSCFLYFVCSCFLYFIYVFILFEKKYKDQ